MSLAFGHCSSTCMMLPEWSRSSWLMKSQRTSAGSTSANASFRKVLRWTIASVSSSMGCWPRMTIALTGSFPTPGTGSVSGMT